MPQIIDMSFRRRKPERFVISWNNGETHLISPETALKFGMSPGRTFEEPVYQKLLLENEVRLSKDQMLNYLSRRPHSRRELVIKSAQKGYSPAAIERALDDLGAVGLINDREFAELFIQNEMLLRPCSKRLIREKLREKGVAEPDFEQALAKLFSTDDERRALHKLTEKFLKRNRNQPRTRVERLVRHLQGKGFAWELIQEAIEIARGRDADEGEEAEYDA